MIGRLFDHKPDMLLPQTLYWILVAVHVSIKVLKGNVMNGAMFAPVSHDQADQHIKQNVIAHQS